MQKSAHTTIELTDKTVSYYALGVAVLLVAYMVITLGSIAVAFVTNIPVLVDLFGSTTANGEYEPQRQIIETGVLHTIAFAIVLIKAYNILISYAKTRHINIKYLVEISIIAPAVEIIFNSHAYSLSVLILLAVFGVANLVIYIVFYDKFKVVGETKHVSHT